MDGTIKFLYARFFIFLTKATKISFDIWYSLSYFSSLLTFKILD